MATLFFSGEEVAYFSGIDDNGDNTSTLTGILAPFLSTDIVEIEIRDQDIDPSGIFDPDEVQFTRVTVVREGVRYDFDVEDGSKVKESGGGSNSEQGEAFFTTNDSVGPPSDGPFAGLDEEKMVFAVGASFETGEDETLDRGTGEFDTGPVITPPPCFATGTLILTPDGERRVETLRPGDLVSTVDHGAQPVLWTISRECHFRDRFCRHQPVEFKPGSLGNGQPSTRLVVSPLHRMLMGGAPIRQRFGTGDVLAPAKGLIDLPGVRLMAGKREVTYHTLLFERHEVIMAAGCRTESFYPGDYIVSTFDRAVREDLLTVLPSLRSGAASGYPPPCRRLLTVREARELVQGRLQGAAARPQSPRAGGESTRSAVRA